MKKRDIKRLRQAAEAIHEALQSDLEMGSHHLNNAASEEFARRHHFLAGAISNLNEVLLSLDNEDEEGGEPTYTDRGQKCNGNCGCKCNH